MSCMLSISGEMDRDNPLESFTLFSRVWVDQRFRHIILFAHWRCGMIPACRVMVSERLG